MTLGNTVVTFGSWRQYVSLWLQTIFLLSYGARIYIYFLGCLNPFRKVTNGISHDVAEVAAVTKKKPDLGGIGFQ